MQQHGDGDSTSPTWADNNHQLSQLIQAPHQCQRQPFQDVSDYHWLASSLMTFQSVLQWQCSYAALISIRATPGRVRGGRQAGGRASKQNVWQHAKSSTAVRFLEDHKCPLSHPSESWCSLSLRYAGFCWLTHCLQWPQTDCDEWWASCLAGPFFHLSYFLCRHRNRMCDGGKKRLKWKVPYRGWAAGEEQDNVALKSTFPCSNCSLRNHTWMQHEREAGHRVQLPLK